MDSKDIQKSIWNGTVPIVITLSSDDVTDFVIPRPLHLTVPRLILWSSVITIVHSYFIKQTAPLDPTFYPYDNKFLLTSNPILEACAQELDLAEVKSPVWLEGPGKTIIDWKVPVGVCVDLWTSTGAVNSQYLDHSASFPIKIVAHFTKRPDGLNDNCHIVVCRGWSTQHKAANKDDDSSSSSSSTSNSSQSSSSSASKSSNDLIAKHAMTTTKRALIEHNTRALLPVFLQLPSSTHIQTSLSRLRMSSSILHKTPTYVMGLPTTTQSQFVSCLFSNSCAELTTVIPMCDCTQCTTFLTTLAGYELQPGSLSVSSKAAKAVKVRVQKVISALKRDGSDSDDEPDHHHNHHHSNNSTHTNNNEHDPDDKNDHIANMVTAGNDSLTTNKATTIHRSDMTKEQREQYSILTTPSTMLLCQITRLIILTRTLCGTWSSFEKASDRLDLDVKDAWRRRAGRLDLEFDGNNNNNNNNTTSNNTDTITHSASDFFDESTKATTPSTPTSPRSSSSTTTPSNQQQSPFRMPNGWKPYYHNLPIKIYTTQHLTMLAGLKNNNSSQASTPTSKTNLSQQDSTNGFQLKWSKFRLVSSISSNSDSSTTNTDNNVVLTVNNPMGSPLSPYCENYTVEQFLEKICPNWKYIYDKPITTTTTKDDDADDGNDDQTTTSEKEDSPIVIVCHGIVIPYNTPLIWLYNHMIHADLALHLVIALQEDVHAKC